MSDFEKLNEKFDAAPTPFKKAVYIFIMVLSIILFMMSLLVLIVSPIVAIISIILSVCFFTISRRNLKNLNLDNSNATKANNIQQPIGKGIPHSSNQTRKIIECFDCNVTGVTMLHDGIDPQRLIANMDIDDEIILIADPMNEVDNFAIKVCNSQGLQVGWLPRGSDEQLKTYEILMRNELAYACVKKTYDLYSRPGCLGLVIYINYFTEATETDTVNEPTYIPPIYDHIDDDIYKCFIDYSGNYIPDVTIQMFDKVCREHNGRCYKTAAKSAKFVVIADPIYQTNQRVEKWHDRGYKVTDIDTFVEYIKVV